MPKQNENEIERLYAVFVEAHIKSMRQRKENLTKDHIAKIEKFKETLLATPFSQLVSDSSKHAKELCEFYKHCIAQLDKDNQKHYLNKIIDDFSKQLQALKKIEPTVINYTEITNAFNEKIIRTPFSYFSGNESNRDAAALQKYFVFLIFVHF